MDYEHTQQGTLMIYVLLGVTVLFGVILSQSGYQPFLLVFMICILLILYSFGSLTVSINDSVVKVKFGWGIYKRTIPLKDITSTQVVKNHWYYGWGIRYWFWPRMTIYNVSGFDAVEIKLKDGRLIRIGTNEPESLYHAVAQKIKK